MDLRLIHDATFNGIIFVEVFTHMRIIFLFFYFKKKFYILQLALESQKTLSEKKNIYKYSQINQELCVLISEKKP
jgi:hypothetical protein